MQRIVYPKLIYSWMLLLACACGVSGQTISADKLLKQASQSLGGEKVFRAITTRQAKGTFTQRSDGRSGKMQITTQHPNFYLKTTELDGFETAEAYNGKSSWQRDLYHGLRTRVGQDSFDFQFAALFHNQLWFDAKKNKVQIVSGGKDTVNGKAANLVTLISNRNSRIKLWLDAANGMPLRAEFSSGESTLLCDYGDYRKVGGWMEAHALTLTVKKGERTETYDIKFDNIQHNTQLEAKLFDFPQLSNEALPDIPALLNAVDVNERRAEKLLDNYGFTETTLNRKITKDGKVKEDSQTRELTFYKGRRLKRLIAQNGKPLTPAEQEKEIRDVEKQIKKIEENLAKEARNERKESAVPGEDEDGRPFSVVNLFKASRFVNPRRERFRERDVIVFDFEPNPESKVGQGLEKFGSTQAGAVWIDPNDKQVVRLESRFIETFKFRDGAVWASFSKGSTFVMESTHVNNEIWLPAQVDINVGVRVFLVTGFNSNIAIRYSDYKRFNVDAEKEKLKAPVATEPKKP
jgi:outer membrane lipoprotein-sorting protein